MRNLREYELEYKKEYINSLEYTKSIQYFVEYKKEYTRVQNSPKLSIHLSIREYIIEYIKSMF